MFVKATWSFSSKTELQIVRCKVTLLRLRPYTAELLTYTQASFLYCSTSEQF